MQVFQELAREFQNQVTKLNCAAGEIPSSSNSDLSHTTFAANHALNDMRERIAGMKTRIPQGKYYSALTGREIFDFDYEILQQYAIQIDHSFENVSKGLTLSNEGRAIEFSFYRPFAETTGLERADLELIANLSALTKISAHNMPALGLASLAALQYLRSLTLTAIYGEFDPSPISALTRLEHLNLNGSQVFKDPELFRPLVNLKELDLHGNHHIRDITALENLTRLEKLTIGCTTLGSLAPLAKLHALNTLALWQCGISDVTELAGLTSLRSLEISSNRIADLSPLAALPILQDLRVAAYDGSDLTPLLDCHALKYLRIEFHTVKQAPFDSIRARLRERGVEVH